MAERRAIPVYLSLEEAAERLKNWGKWGPDDHVGTLNYTTPEDIVNAAVPEALADPQVAGRGMVVPLAHPSIPDFRVTGTPVRLSATPAAPFPFCFESLSWRPMPSRPRERGEPARLIEHQRWRAVRSRVDLHREPPDPTA